MRKVILLISSLVVLSSCGGSKSSKSESCSLNDQSVSCDALHASDKSGPFDLVSEVTTAIQVRSSRYETLESKDGTKSVIKNGTEYSCTAVSHLGRFFDYSIIGSTLTLATEDFDHNFKRVSGYDTLEGVWTATDSDQEGSQKIVLTFKGNTLKINVTCHFN